MSHAFIFAPGVWKGEGKITFSMADDELDFKVTWIVLAKDENKIHFSQEVDLIGVGEKMRNQFCVSSITSEKFEIQLQNQLVRKVVGVGLINSHTIAWEFHNKDQEFEGYEIYDLQDDGSYHMRAEFTAGEGLRTHVKGWIRKT